ncbi:hypothetical protein AAY473_018538 [Plecturocebus cupreus]
MCHHTRLTLVFFVEMRFHHVAQAGFELLGSSDLPASASKTTGITGINTVSSHSVAQGLNSCSPGWSAVVQSWLTAASTSLAQRWGFIMLPRLVLNSLAEAIHLPQSPKTESCSVTQAGVQWCNLGSLHTALISQGQVILPSSWDYSYVLPCTQECFTMFPRLVLNSWAQAVLLPQPPKVLGFQVKLSLDLAFTYFGDKLEMGFHDDGQPSIELLTSSDSLTSASQSVTITGISHSHWPGIYSNFERSSMESCSVIQAVVRGNLCIKKLTSECSVHQS